MIEIAKRMLRLRTKDLLALLMFLLLTIYEVMRSPFHQYIHSILERNE